MRRVHFIDTVSSLSYSTLLSLWASSMLFFALSYLFLSYFPGHGPSGIEGDLLERLGSSLYYSVITATNTGYGDIVPLGASRALAAIQSISELFLFALFVSKLVSRRQEATLDEVHTLTFEMSFHTIREGFYVARKDFDRLIDLARDHAPMTESEHERLAIALQHVGSLMHDIPNFYAVTSDLYVIDERREALLLEAVHRTMLRLDIMLAAIDETGGAWTKEADELDEMLRSFDEILPLWARHAHAKGHPTFRALTTTTAAIRTRLANARQS